MAALIGYDLSLSSRPKWNGIALSSVSPLVERLENELREIANEPAEAFRTAWVSRY
jgi:hypothetical protein